MLYQDDDFGKDYLKGLVDGLGTKASVIKVKASYETMDPTVDSHMIQLQALDCDTLVTYPTHKFRAPAIRKMAKINWKPLHIPNGIASSVGAT